MYVCEREGIWFKLYKTQWMQYLRNMKRTQYWVGWSDGSTDRDKVTHNPPKQNP